MSTTCCASGLKRAIAGPSVVPKPNREALIVTVAGAAGQVGYALLPMIASGEVFGPNQRIVIQVLDLNLPQVRDNMKAIKFELEDGNFPLLDEITMHIDETEALKNADYAVLLGSWPQAERKSRKDIVEMNHLIFRTMGKALDTHAKKTCKVVVVGAPASTNALICANYAPSLPKSNFSAFSRLLHNRALAQVAARAGAPVDRVKKLAVWGGACTTSGQPQQGQNSSGQYLDLDHCTVGGKNLSEVFSREEDKKWLAEGLPDEMQTRGQKILEARKASPALSVSRAISDHIRKLHCGTGADDFLCMGVWTEGRLYDVSDGLFVSMPVVCEGNGRYAVVKGLPLSTSCRDKLKQAEKDLIDDRDLAHHFFGKHGAV